MTGSRLSAGPRTSIRVRAALAGGLVFGLAAGLTVASWTDATYGGATFTASQFGIQTSVQGGTYSPASTVSTSVSGLYPSATVTTGNKYVSLKVKTTSSSIAGNVRLSALANGGGGLTPVLRYRVVTIASANTCGAASFTTDTHTFVVGGSTAYQKVSEALAATSTTALAAAGAGEMQYCIELSIPPATPQAGNVGQSATLTLSVRGTST